MQLIASRRGLLCSCARMKRQSSVQTAPVKKAKKPKPLLLPSIDASGPLLSKAARIAAQLQALYPNPPIPLKHDSSFQLLCACMLSAQSTDVKVNEVTPELFRRWPTAAVMATAKVPDIEGIIRVLGLAPTKAKNLSAMSKVLVEQHGGEVPDSFEALESLPGIGHKTASVVMSQAFNHVAFPVDTHIHRLAQRWGLSNGHSVEQTEADLKALLPECSWRDAHLQIIYFGREHCPAVGHDPSGCVICSWAAVPPYNKMGSSPARPGQKPPSLSKQFTPTKLAPQQPKQATSTPTTHKQPITSTAAFSSDEAAPQAQPTQKRPGGRQVKRALTIAAMPEQEHLHQAAGAAAAAAAAPDRQSTRQRSSGASQPKNMPATSPEQAQAHPATASHAQPTSQELGSKRQAATALQAQPVPDGSGRRRQASTQGSPKAAAVPQTAPPIEQQPEEQPSTGKQRKRTRSSSSSVPPASPESEPFITNKATPARRGRGTRGSGTGASAAVDQPEVPNS